MEEAEHLFGTSPDNLNEAINTSDIENVVLKSLNRLVVALNLNHPRVSSLLQISSDIYLMLFDKIFGYKPLDIVLEPKTYEDEAHNIQCIIDTLSLDILGVSLSHIAGENIVARKPLPIYHLLEIISEFVLDGDLQATRSSISVPLPVSSSSPISNSNASHKEHDCPVCEYALGKALGDCRKPSTNTYLERTICSHHTGSQFQEEPILVNSISSTATSKTGSQNSSRRALAASVTISQKDLTNSWTTVSEPPKKRMKQELSFNELLAQKLVKKLEALKDSPTLRIPSRDLPGKFNHSTMDSLYKSVCHREKQQKTAVPPKETSVLLPRYLRRRKSSTKKSRDIKNIEKEQKRPQPPVKRKAHTGILEEIQSEVPGVHFTANEMQGFEHAHQRQVKFLSSRLLSLQKKVSASEKLLQEKILKQVQLSDIEQKDQEDKKRLMKIKSLRNARLKTSGAIKDCGIRRARSNRYFDQYYLQHKRKLSSQQTKGELLLRNLYNHRLALQKQQMIDVSNDLRAQEKEEVQQLENRIASMENFYHDKSELQKEKSLVQNVQTKSSIQAQHQVLDEIRRAMLRQIETEVTEIQKNLERENDFHFVQADAERLKQKWVKPR